MTNVSIEPISRSKRDLSRFFDVADRIYADDPNWVPPLRDDVANVFADKNPFFRHAEIQLFVARRGAVNAARIPAILDLNQNDFHGEKMAIFEFFHALFNIPACHASKYAYTS